MKHRNNNNLLIFARMILMPMLLGMLMLSSCNYIKYAEGVIEDTQKRFDKNKAYMYGLNFKGVITEKEYCDKCKICKFKITIKISQLGEKPSVSTAGYPPYYMFESNNLLNLAVSKEIYQQVKEQDEIYKESESVNLKIGAQEFLYLSMKESEWLP